MWNLLHISNGYTEYDLKWLNNVFFNVLMLLNVIK